MPRRLSIPLDLSSGSTSPGGPLLGG